MQRGRPAARRRFERGGGALVERALQHVGEQALDLLTRERKLRRVELEHVAPRAQPLERERRRGACGDPHLEPVRRVAQQRLHHRDHAGLVRDLVEVVEHEQPRRALERGDRVRQHAAQDLARARAGLELLEHALEVLAEARLVGAERREQVATEHCGIGVGAEERIPEDRPAQPPRCRDQQRRLAVARVGDDERERPVAVRSERVDQARALEQVRALVRAHELRAQERRGRRRGGRPGARQRVLSGRTAGRGRAHESSKSGGT
jgi:hypothetical protein